VLRLELRRLHGVLQHRQGTVSAIPGAGQQRYRQAGFIAAGADAVTATNRAYFALWGMLQRQAAMVSFVTIFRALGILFLILIPLVMLMRRPKSGAVVDAGH
jgi:hypothetical protein